jgi:DNA polymerase III epsilon subunit-like protein
MHSRARGIHDRPDVARPSKAVALEPRSRAVRTSSSTCFSSQTPIAVFDFETTGLNPGHDLVLDIDRFPASPLALRRWNAD